jgi:hypothetical protein
VTASGTVPACTDMGFVTGKLTPHRFLTKLHQQKVRLSR